MSYLELALKALKDANSSPAGDAPEVRTGDERNEINEISPPLLPDWHFLWDERAAIMEYDGGLPRERAEARALNNIIQVMQRTTKDGSASSFRVPKETDNAHQMRSFFDRT
jgi:hypothetical protein